MKITWIHTILGVVMTGSLTAGEVTTAATTTKTLRDLEADRPDATESPRTVDAGHFQVEMSLLGYSRDRSGGMRSESWTWAETNIKYGLNDSMDLQLVFSPYVRESVRGNGCVRLQRVSVM